MKAKFLRTNQTLSNLVTGAYGTRLFFTRLLGEITRRIKGFLKEFFNGKKTEWIAFLSIMAYNTYQYGINNIEFLTYMAPDEEVHLYWIQSLIGGNMFPSGVYPHVFHNILGGFSTLFGISALVTLKYIGMTMIVLIMTMLYFGLRKIFTTKYPALFALLMYSVLNIYADQATYRFQFAIPQEYAMIMLMPMAMFLLDYIQEKKIMDLVFFGISLSLMLGIHFYTGIIAIILILSIGLSCGYKIIKDKVFLKLLVCGVLSLTVALGPLGLGLALGHEMEQSMNWGAEVVRGDIYSQKSEPELVTWSTFTENVEKDLSKHLVKDINMFYIYLIITLLTILFNMALMVLKKGDVKSSYQIIFALNSLLLVFLMLFRSLQLPTIMETKRLAIFFAYFSPIWIGMPLEMISRGISTTPFRQGMSFIGVGAMGIGLFLAIQFDYIRPVPAFYYFQPRGTMLVNMDIMEKYENHTWTAVSPVNNISSILNHGYHYEIRDFILSQEKWHQDKEIRIPTQYVFLYIEKRPIIKYGYRFYRDQLDISNRKMVNKEDALKDLRRTRDVDFHYREERDILMAKAYYWAEEYQKYFPKEMNVYYEDEELIVYRIQQNQYALNNFSIDYGFNSR